MALEPISAIVGFIALKLAKGDDDGERHITVVAKGKQLTSGYVNPQGTPIQPTYEMVDVRVLAPPAKLIYKTARKHAFSDTSKPKVQYGVVYYSANDDGRRTYSFPNGEKPDGKQERNGAVFSNMTEGYYIAQYLPDNARPYNGTGIKGWFILRPDNRPYGADKEMAIAKCKEMFEQKMQPQPAPKPEEPPFSPQPPMPDFGGGMVSYNQTEGGEAQAPAPLPPPTGGQPTTPTPEPEVPPPTLEPNEPEPEPFPEVDPTIPDPTNPLDPTGGGMIGGNAGGGITIGGGMP